ncbi:hypothetical protein [Oxynema sp. CENA135]
MDGRRSLAEDIHRQGLDWLTPFPEGDLAEFHRFELSVALNRLRSLKVR